MTDYGDWRILVFDRGGIPLAEMDPISFLFTGSLSEQGTAEIILSSRNDPKCRRDILKPGNFVEFSHARLGDWVGIIVPHDGMEWTGQGEVIVRMREASFQFARRRAPLYDPESLEPALVMRVGEVMAWIIKNCNGEEDTRLREGDLYSSGRNVVVPLNDRPYSVIIEEDLLARKNLVMWCEPDRDEHNRLIVKVNLREIEALDTGEYLILQEDINLETPTGTWYREDVELVNDIITRNNGADDGGMLRFRMADRASIAEYGMWQNVVVTSTDEESLVRRKGQQALNEGTRIKQKPLLTVMESEEDPSAFLKVRLGRVVRVLLHSQNQYYNETGVDMLVRIASMEYETNANKVIITPEQVTQ